MVALYPFFLILVTALETMASIIQSDMSISTRYLRGRAESAASAVDRLTDAKHVTQLSAVLGNTARDGAMQINGHVTDKISNLNCKYLIIPCQCEVVRAMANIREAPKMPFTVPVEPRLPATLKRSTHYNIVESAEISTLLKKKQIVNICSKTTELSDTFCVIFPQRVQDNFISSKLVVRLGLSTYFDTMGVSSIVWVSQRLFSTGDFVNVPLPMQGRGKSMTRRFYILKDSPFDMILGTSATSYFP
ncbi:hypothetical protein DE146DRAFT_669811 [Phaeosphaeria sp. MPI-PUGE-AT-0046c]|nr:hypothetical protein DE146DRAFT_669811 [Phaeosphaeria sp. MPI-PUGE-AT-0046c]